MEVLANLDPLLRELGRLVFNFNAAEQALRRLAFLLIDPQEPRTGEITIDRLGANGLEELVAALAPHRLTQKVDLVARVQDAVRRFGQIRLRRNELVHALWVVPNEATDLKDMSAVRRKFRQGTHSVVNTASPETVATAASEASSAGQELESLYDAVKQETS